MIKHIYIVLQCPRFDLRPADGTDRMLMWFPAVVPHKFLDRTSV